MAKSRNPLEFFAVPSYFVEQERRDRYSIISAASLAGIFGLTVRLTAGSQRLLFGSNMFGMKAITINNDGIGYSFKVAFGTDFVAGTIPWDDVERYIREGRKPNF